MTRPFRIVTHPWLADQSVAPVSMRERAEEGVTTRWTFLSLCCWWLY